MSRYSIHAWYLVAYYVETTVDRVKRWLETTKLREPIGLAFFFHWPKNRLSPGIATPEPWDLDAW